MSAPAPAPLEGVRVLDLTELLPGPLATQALADLGAEVVKVERPGGDPLRTMIPGYFAAVNRGKRSVVLDLKDPGDRETAHRLAATSDVAVEGYRPGVAARLGVDHAALTACNPRIVSCSISGFGQAGPARLAPAHDLNFLGLGGALELEPDEPFRLGTELPVADALGAAFAACAIVAGLRRPGTHVDVSLQEAVLAGIARVLGEHAARGRPDALPTRPAYGVFRARDGRPLVVGCTEEHFFRGLCEMLGLDALAADPALAGWEARAQQAGRIASAIADRLRTRTAAEWLADAEARGLPVTPVHLRHEIALDPQVQARGGLWEEDGAPVVPFPALWDGARARARRPVPELDADAADLLASPAWLGPLEPTR